ncbi:rabankyrin-5-like [Amphibalanus amphitrite]|uniref:rabankyrin-5-like n=1 Tax=Amphibalanus amphitrite TaxID=1232801 RepID=UPI001C8FE3E4|nr:rabankyrin-5-like [Amphibalanus amphitrite]
MDNQGEVHKLQLHLSLLREEYVRLQRDLADVSRKYAILSAESGAQGGEPGGYVASLVATVADLFRSKQFSDLSVKVGDQVFQGHKFVFVARGSHWGVKSVADVVQLDWTDINYEVGMEVLQWIYTDQAALAQGDDFVLDVMRTADRFKLDQLKTKCENALMSSVSVKNCIKFYTTADDIGAGTLKDYCSRLISTHWNDFTSEDFAHMKAPLVYEMFKSKTRYPLHAAIRLLREDVVFLFLIEFNAQLPARLNEPDDRDNLPLDLALRLDQAAICETLLKHRVDVNAADGQGRCLLHKAILRDDESSALFLVDHGAAVDGAVPVSGDTPLHLLATGGPQDEWRGRLARRLLDAGADTNAQNSELSTPLHVCVSSGCTPVFDVLITRPCDLERRDRRGHTVLWHALLAGVQQNSMAQRLVTAGASVDAVNQATQDTLLHQAALNDLEEEAIFLVKAKAKTGAFNKQGETVLHVAAAHGLSRLVAELLRRGANANAATARGEAGGVGEPHRQTAAHLAVQYRHRDVVAAILEHRRMAESSPDANTIIPDLNLKDSNDRTPLALALDMNMNEVALELIRGGASVDIPDLEGDTLLHRAIRTDNGRSATFLLKNGADINCRTRDGLSPLQLSIERGLLSVIELLCESGADLSSSPGHDPPLWQALAGGHTDAASVLVRFGIDTDCWGEGPDGCYQTLLHRAIDENNEHITGFLIRSGCDVSSARRPGPDGRGGDEARDQMTPLHLCAQWGLQETVQALLEHGANANARDCDQKTPLHHAIENGHTGIITLLLSAPETDLTARDRLGRAPFTLAMTMKNNKAAQAILGREPGVAEQYDSRGRNFLHVAIEKKDIESVMFLLSIHVNVHSRTRDSLSLTPLHLAAQADSEIILRNLMLAGARLEERTPLKQTALHLAAERDCHQCVSVLIDKEVDFNAVDNNLDNALHVACKEGHLSTVRVLLTESQIDAESTNLRGRTPLHMVAALGRENAAAICQLFLESMPKYPLDKQDAEGNTALLLAYMKGNVNLCMTLVKAGASLGIMNNQGVSIFNFQVATKQLLFRLLDALSQEPGWNDGDHCMECGTKFGIATRKHHCRHCGRLLCNKCSDKQLPIVKYNINKPIRVCDTCYDVLTLGAAMFG